MFNRKRIADLDQTIVKLQTRIARLEAVTSPSRYAAVAPMNPVDLAVMVAKGQRELAQR